MDAREQVLAEVIERTGATEVHPYDDPLVIAGQGTAALELLRSRPDIGAVVAPVSGGGLMSGSALAAHGIDPKVSLWGAEPATVDDAARSLAAGVRLDQGNGSSIADGLLAVLSDRTFTVLVAHGVEIVTVTEEEIVDAMALVFTRMKQVVEPSAATAVAALIALGRRDVDLPADVGVILSGGNVDLDRLPFGEGSRP
jgi:threonine dehydratase